MSLTWGMTDISLATSLSPGLDWPDSVDSGIFDRDYLLKQPRVSVLQRAIEKKPYPANDSTEEPGLPTDQRYLVVSPYKNRAHLLNLSLLDISCQLLASTLSLMRPVRADYATAPYAQAFNWSSCFDYLKCLVGNERSKGWEPRQFYVVVFRSQIPKSTDRSRLAALDKIAHREAMESGGLLKYWFGTPDRTGRNLATCIWRRREDARLGGNGPGHAKAMQETRALYTEWRVERLWLHIGLNAASWKFVECD